MLLTEARIQELTNFIARLLIGSRLSDKNIDITKLTPKELKDSKADLATELRKMKLEDVIKELKVFQENASPDDADEAGTLIKTLGDDSEITQEAWEGKVPQTIPRIVGMAGDKLFKLSDDTTTHKDTISTIEDIYKQITGQKPEKMQFNTASDIDAANISDQLKSYLKGITPPVTLFILRLSADQAVQFEQKCLTPLINDKKISFEKTFEAIPTIASTLTSPTPPAPAPESESESESKNIVPPTNTSTVVPPTTPPSPSLTRQSSINSEEEEVESKEKDHDKLTPEFEKLENQAAKMLNPMQLFPEAKNAEIGVFEELHKQAAKMLNPLQPLPAKNAEPELISKFLTKTPYTKEEHELKPLFGVKNHSGDIPDLPAPDMIALKNILPGSILEDGSSQKLPINQLPPGVEATDDAQRNSQMPNPYSTSPRSL